jgi:FdhD/NarQ family
MRTEMPLAEPQTEPIPALMLQPAARARCAVPGGPQMTQACGELLRKIPILDAQGDQRVIEVPVERPLSICLDGQFVATLWTLGASAEWLVLGYLWTRQFVNVVTAIELISINWADGIAGQDPRWLLARASARRAALARFCRPDRHRPGRHAADR